MKPISDIKSLIDEIEFYESRGKFKIADRLTNELRKFAYEAKVEDAGPFGAAYIRKDNLELAICMVEQLGCLKKALGNKYPLVFPDIKNCITNQMNQGKSLKEATDSCQQALSAKDPLMNTPELRACFDNLSLDPTIASKCAQKKQPANIVDSIMSPFKAIRARESVPM